MRDLMLVDPHKRGAGSSTNIVLYALDMYGYTDNKQANARYLLAFKGV